MPGGRSGLGSGFSTLLMILPTATPFCSNSIWCIMHHFRSDVKSFPDRTQGLNGSKTQTHSQHRLWVCWFLKSTGTAISSGNTCSCIL
jgi:hypothetical protein